MTNAILRGKPYAGNPHVRFDEGEVASASAGGPLLYNTRRDFLNSIGGVLAGGALAGGCVSAHGRDRAEDGVRFCAFADIHYCQVPHAYPHCTTDWLDRILARAADGKADFIVSLGDMSFNPVLDKSYIERYLDFAGAKTYYVLGNHEFQERAWEEIAPVCRLKTGHYFWDCKGFRFIALDPHYHRRPDGEIIRYCRRCSYPEDEVANYIVPPDQISWLKETIAASPHPCVVMAHEHFEDATGSVYNHAEIRKVLTDANAASPGKVRLVINGHEHKDHFRILDGVPYLDLNSASYDIGRDHTAYPPEAHRLFRTARCVITWNDPLSAMITLTPDGGLRIEGVESSYYLGVTPEMAGWPAQRHPTSPRIQSVDLTFRY